MLGEKQVIHKVFCIDSPIALVLLDSALGFQLCIRTWLGKVLKKKQQRKSHRDSADASACVQAQSGIASLPENLTEISTSIPLDLISTERIPFFF